MDNLASSGVWAVWVLMGVGLVAWVLTGGADYGGGLWDLLASGPRKEAQRSLIAEAIAPIWEANHVWIIFLVVMMFSVFPRAFFVVSVALHIPLVLALFGMVLRGAAFTFRAYGLQPDAVGHRWGRVFAWSSALTPVFLGMALGAMSTGDLRHVNGLVTSGFLAGWTSPFSFTVGLFALALFALLAAVYLTADAASAELAEDFRGRALAAELVAGVLAALVAWRASVDAPALWAALAGSSWTWPVQLGTAAAAIAVLAALVTRRFALARFAVAAQVGLVVLGWGLAMDGFIVRPDVHVTAAGTRPEMMGPLMVAVSIGLAVLLPSLWLLFRVFKRSKTADDTTH